MTRYYLLAALIVVLAGSILVAHRLRPADLRIRADAAGTPTVETARAPEPRGSAPPFAGEGTWVLSALPACLVEGSRAAGPAAALRAGIPPAAARIVAPAVVRAGPCTILVRAHDVVAVRGPDRLRVPPEAALYRTGAGWTLVAAAAGRVEIRTYALP